MEEDNYKFRLSAFKEPLIAWLSAEPNGTNAIPQLLMLIDLL